MYVRTSLFFSIIFVTLASCRLNSTVGAGGLRDAGDNTDVAGVSPRRVTVSWDKKEGAFDYGIYDYDNETTPVKKTPFTSL